MPPGLPDIRFPAPPASAATRSGRDIYTRFHDGLADPTCDGASSPRWLRQFSTAPSDLAESNSDLLPLFGYVVDALRAANLPTEYALIPFVESGYKPGARSPGGPAGLWQMIALTARDHAVPVRPGYDGRLSPIDSTRAAVRYLKTLHGLFAGDWRLAVMAYNAGEYRVFSALRRSGQVARSADPEKLVGMSDISRAYVRKLHALSCLLDHADDNDGWLRALDRQVPILAEVEVPVGVSNLPGWATRNGWDAADIQRLNPAFTAGRVPRSSTTARILAPMASPAPARSQPTAAVVAVADPAPPVAIASDQAPRTHRVSRGDSLQKIAHRYRMTLADLLLFNGLVAHSALHPGMVLKLEAAGDR